MKCTSVMYFAVVSFNLHFRGRALMGTTWLRVYKITWAKKKKKKKSMFQNCRAYFDVPI